MLFDLCIDYCNSILYGFPVSGNETQANCFACDSFPMGNCSRVLLNLCYSVGFVHGRASLRSSARDQLLVLRISTKFYVSCSFFVTGPCESSYLHDGFDFSIYLQKYVEDVFIRFCLILGSMDIENMCAFELACISKQVFDYFHSFF